MSVIRTSEEARGPISGHFRHPPPNTHLNMNLSRACNYEIMFSVVVPVYNKVLYVNRAIDSILNQDYSNFEVIVVDDNSSDSSWERVRSYGECVKAFRHSSRRGVGPARNTGILRATGKYIAFLDADDYWHPCHLTTHSELCQKFPHAGLLATSYSEVDNLNFQPCQSVQQSLARVTQIDYFKQAGEKIGTVWTGCIALRRDIFSTVGLFSSARSGEDLEFWARVALHSVVVKSSRVTACYIRVSDSLMAEVHSLNIAPRRPVSTNLDVSPSVSMLIKRIRRRSIPSSQLPSVLSYINGRVASSFSISLWNKRFCEAIAFRNQTIHPASMRIYILACVTFFPHFFLGFAVDCMRAVLRGYRRLKF